MDSTPTNTTTTPAIPSTAEMADPRRRGIVHSPNQVTDVICASQLGANDAVFCPLVPFQTWIIRINAGSLSPRDATRRPTASAWLVWQVESRPQTQATP